MVFCAVPLYSPGGGQLERRAQIRFRGRGIGGAFVTEKIRK
jgi:hypothetical protein